MSRRISAAWVLAGAIALGCRSKADLPAPPPNIPSAPPLDLPSNARIDLARTACMGRCPVYTLGIKGDGTVLYFGEEFVRVRGPQTKTIDAGAAGRLVRDLVRSGFLTWKDHYETPATDLPEARISLVLGTTKKTISDYGPGQRELDRTASEVRDKLEALEVRVDAVAKSAEWVTCPDEEEGRCHH